VISFGAGEPDFDTPERIKAAAVEAMRRGQTKYTEVAGIPELRRAVCAKFKRDNGLEYEPADVLVACGAKHVLFNMVVAVLDPGDEVLIPSPYWVSYPEQARLVGGVPVEVATSERTGFDLDPERLSAAVTPRTKVIVLNSPNNPTGAVFSAEALRAVARLAVERDLLVVSDECYEALTFEGRHVSIASLGPEIRARTLVINTCSKAFANVSALFGRSWESAETPVRLRGSLDVAAFLLAEARVAVVPGLDFGADTHVRLSYATSDALIGEGLARMGAAIRKLR